MKIFILLYQFDRTIFEGVVKISLIELFLKELLRLFQFKSLHGQFLLHLYGNSSQFACLLLTM